MLLNFEKTSKKYFSSYAEKEINIATEIPKNFFDFDHSLTVPLYDELLYFENLVNSAKSAADFSQKKILLILVVNSRKKSPKIAKENNKKILQTWKKKLKSSVSFLEKNNFFCGTLDSLGFIFIDRTSEHYEFEEKKGVGLARKIACDLASFLCGQKKIRSTHIFTTDGDALLPENFFILPKISSKYFFMLSKFRHETKNESEKIKAGIEKYEAYLNSYTNGLLFAKSPYAFHTIGSCISFSYEAYILVRGFPKNRLAGEDFYFLNKISKLAEYHEHIAHPILLSSRLSERVPFGTGRAILKTLEPSKEETFIPYETSLFSFLKAYLDFAKNFFFSGKEKKIALKTFCKEAFPEEEWEKIPLFMKVIEENALIKEIKKIASNSLKPETQFKNFSDFFDAFKTLKFIHNLKRELLK